MKLFSIFGDPVSHSISPLMHNYLYRSLNIDACYGRYHLKDASKLKESFIAQKLDGANITVPFKERAYDICDEIKGDASQIKAVNTLVNQNGKLVGYNTDAEGLYLSALKLSNNAPFKKVLILGAGGTAKAAAYIFSKNSCDVTVTNRSEGKLKYFDKKGIKTYSHESLDDFEYDLVINTTSAGLKDDSLPIKEDILDQVLINSSYCIDAIYNKNTPFLKKAKDFDNSFKDGLDMLIFQGIIAFNIFTQSSFELDMLQNKAKEAIALI